MKISILYSEIVGFQNTMKSIVLISVTTPKIETLTETSTAFVIKSNIVCICSRAVVSILISSLSSNNKIQISKDEIKIRTTALEQVMSPSLDFNYNL
ncbi:uncharacterized protein KGF55_002606 [Candida pseudojiufengensis]|uniref:uncharacterized protein n=1 Tax=Candida pseudojiufengensis TaxID=497109 RepID=UPI002224DC85|nr:uncharacterized protein KGF55_002606 [Candida pseudojiufengensis]KAI5963726.1 hypothetical protein KGF55_002606 [Candida pseudojiufengensis]